MTRLNELVKRIPGIGETGRMKEHPAALHYFTGSTDFYICEYNGADEMFGFAILNGDVRMSEFGYFGLSKLRQIDHLNLDYYFEEQSIEAARFTSYPVYFKRPESLR
jgi:hypothetical protein